jgi:hypothetical protein
MIDEFKTYRATEGNIGHLIKRFEEKTMPIFAWSSWSSPHNWKLFQS